MKTALSYFLTLFLVGTLALPSLAQRSPNQGQGTHKGELDPQLKAFLERNLNQMNAREKAQLAHALWLYYLGQQKGDQLPFLTENPPKDPPVKAPCKDCGTVQKLPTNDCGSLKDEIDEAYKKVAALDLAMQVVRDFKKYKGKIDFADGVADVISNGITVYTFATTFGTGTVASKVATKKMKSLVIDELKSRANDALADALPAPYGDMVSGSLDEVALDKIMDALRKARDAAQAERVKKIDAYNECLASSDAAVAKAAESNRIVKKCQDSNPSYCPK